MVLLNPSYWERSFYTDQLINQYTNRFLPRVKFSLENVYKNEEATVDRFTELDGYGIIHIYSHGWAWPKAATMTDVYLMTGEEANDYTTEKYALRMLTGDIFVANAIVDITGTDTTRKNLYFINEAFVASKNDFSKDTVLFYGGFCFSFLGQWPNIATTFAKGAYFGFDWSVLTDKNANWASYLVAQFSDTNTLPPCNPPTYMHNSPEKSYYYDGRTVSIKYVGDPKLTLFRDTTRVFTQWVTGITQTTANSGGIVESDGGSPVTARGLCWSTSSNPTTAGEHTLDGSGLGFFPTYLTGLTPGTPYFIRAYAANSMGTVYGKERNFTTASNAVVTTTVVTNITQTTARCGGNVISDGGFPVIARGVCWSLLPGPTIADSHTTDGSGTGEFESNITGLAIFTPYYIRAYATNSGGTAYGETRDFKTTSLYSIGQNYGGGIIFYIDGTGMHGLIAAPADQSTNILWGCAGTLTGASGTAIGTGQANTTTIVSSCAEASPARICDNLVLNGFDDWFLPSLDELDEMYYQRFAIGGFVTTESYWSSSEYDADQAWFHHFFDEGENYGSKYYVTRYVRAVRAF